MGVGFHTSRMESFPWDSERVQGFSRQLFGKVHRLEVALAILALSDRDPQRIYKEALANALGVGDTEVEKHLSAFRKLGLLERHPQPPKAPGKRGPGRPPIILRPTSDHFWECLQELGERFRRT